MTFSAIAALLGLAAITWYGLADLGASELASAQRRIAEAHLTPPTGVQPLRVG